MAYRPFISWLHDKTIGQFHQATLVYCFDPARAFPSVERMQEIANQSGVRLVHNPTGGGALEATIQQAASEVDPKDVQISFCGPKGLLKHVQGLMKKHNIPADKFCFSPNDWHAYRSIKDDRQRYALYVKRAGFVLLRVQKARMRVSAAMNSPGCGGVVHAHPW